MKLAEAIQRLDRSTGVPGTKRSIKVKRRFSNILQEVKYKELPPEQLALLEHELDSIFHDLNLEEDNVDAYLKRHLKEFLKFLRVNFSLVSEGYCAFNGMRTGLITGTIIMLVLFLYTDSNFIFYAPLGGLLLGVMIGSACDRRKKSQGRALLTRMV